MVGNELIEWRGKEERLLGLFSQIHPSEGSATCNISFTNMPMFPVHMPLQEISLAAQELRRVECLLYRHLRGQPDRGSDYLMELAETAKRPAEVNFIIDPATADLVSFLHFRDQGPIALRFTPEAEHVVLTKLARARRMAVH